MSGWTVDTLKEMLTAQIANLSARLDERYANQVKATDAAFAAQRAATKAAFEAAEKSLQATLIASKEASTKAESATDKRFEATNGFREQLADQARTFLPRQEYETAHTALVEKLDTEVSRNSERLSGLELRISSRLDTFDGTIKGSRVAADDSKWQAVYNQSESEAREQAKYSVIALIISSISIVVAIAMILIVVSRP